MKILAECIDCGTQETIYSEGVYQLADGITICDKCYGVMVVINIK